jgi:hypothetical protein
MHDKCSNQIRSVEDHCQLHCITWYKYREIKSIFYYALKRKLLKSFEAKPLSFIQEAVLCIDSLAMFV